MMMMMMSSDGFSTSGRRTVNDDAIDYVTVTKADMSVVQCNVSNDVGYVYTNIALTVIGQCRTFPTDFLIYACMQNHRYRC